MFDVPVAELLEHGIHLRDSFILITGGGSGFGAALAVLAAQHGATVIVTDRLESPARKTVDAIRAADGEAVTPPEQTDVTRLESLRVAFDFAVRTFGRPPDIVCANAGVSGNDRFEIDDEIVDDLGLHPIDPRPITLNVNLHGALATCELAREYWEKAPSERRRKLVITGSMASLSIMPGFTMYNTSKHGVAGYWRSLNSRLASGELSGFECHVICPFFSKTPMIPKAELAFLAGLPLVPVTAVVHSLFHAASDPSGVGHMYVLPDDHDPYVATWEEYEPFSPIWAQKLDDRTRRYKPTGSATIRFWRELARNCFGLGLAGLAVRGVLGVGLAVLAVMSVNYGLKSLPQYVPVLLGAGFAVVMRRRARTSQLKSHAE